MIKTFSLKKFNAILLFAIVFLSSSIITNNCSAAPASNETVASFLTDVAGIDLTKWKLQPEVKLFPPSTLADQPVMKKYILSCEGNTTDVIAYLKNDKVVWCKLYPVKGTIGNYIRISDSVIDHAKVVLERYQAYSGASYIQPMLNSLDDLTELKNASSVFESGNVIMNTKNEYDRQTIEWLNTANGIYNDYDPFAITFCNGALELFCDYWNRYPISSGEVKTSSEQAIELAKEATYNKISLDVGESAVRDYKFTNEGAQLMMNKRVDVLVPEWEVWLVLDKTVKTYSDTLHLLIWADTGELDLIEYSMSYGVYPTDLNSTTSQTDKPTITQTPTSTPPTDNTRSSQFAIGVAVTAVAIAFAVGSTALIVKKRRK